MLNRVVFSSASDHWETPAAVYDALNAEFQFADDPCPLKCIDDGLDREWKSPCFVNPPYSNIGPWVAKALAESRSGKVVVVLVPSRTDTRWWHEYAMKAREIRFLRGRVKFGGAAYNAPFPSAILVF